MQNSQPVRSLQQKEKNPETGTVAASWASRSNTAAPLLSWDDSCMDFCFLLLRQGVEEKFQKEGFERGNSIKDVKH